MLLTPIIFAVTLSSYIWAPVIAFLPIFGIFAMNFVAIELENPFGIDANDLPLVDFQAEMNSCLLMLLHPNADLIGNLSNDDEKTFEELLGEVTSLTRVASHRQVKRLDTQHLNKEHKLARKLGKFS